MSEPTETPIQCVAAFEAKGPMKPFSYVPRKLQPYEVHVKIEVCGVCSSDVSQLDNKFGRSAYPMCVGHEIVGVATEVGSDVTKIKVGDRVGVGAQRDSCGTCKHCKNNEANLCAGIIPTYNYKYPDGTPAYGGYSTFIRVNAKFVHKIPDNLPSEGVAPMFCAGISTFAPLKAHGVKAGDRVGIIGLGGLGHLAVKFAVALGAQVTVLSTNESKAEDAKKLGAHNFLVTTNTDALKAAALSLDLILCCAGGDNMDFSSFLSLLDKNGKFVMVGITAKPITINLLPFIMKQISLSGSCHGSPDIVEEMLQLASKHNILADVEVLPLEKADEALQGIREGKPKFRYVLKIEQ